MSRRSQTVAGAAAVVIVFGASYLLAQASSDSGSQAEGEPRGVPTVEVVPTSTPSVSLPQIAIDDSPLPELRTPTPTPTPSPTATASQQATPTPTSAPPVGDGGGGSGGGGGGTQEGDGGGGGGFLGGGED